MGAPIVIQGESQLHPVYLAHCADFRTRPTAVVNCEGEVRSSSVANSEGYSVWKAKTSMSTDIFAGGV